MKVRLPAVLAVPLLGLGVAACTVEKEGDGYEVEPAKVEVDWDTTQVKTPDIDVIPRDTTKPDTTVNGSR